MKKKALLAVLFVATAPLMLLQSCNTKNPNPTVPGPLPTGTPTATNTFTPIPTGTPLTCATHVVFSEAAVATVTVNAEMSYVDQFTLSQASNFNAVTIVLAGASDAATGDFINVAIYSDYSNYPLRLLYKSGQKQITTTGSTTYIINPPNFSLPAGTYWLGVHSNIQFEPYQNTSVTSLNYMVSGHFPDPFPSGASSPGARWSYSMDTCHP